MINQTSKLDRQPFGWRVKTPARSIYIATGTPLGNRLSIISQDCDASMHIELTDDALLDLREAISRHLDDKAVGLPMADFEGVA